MSIFKRGTVNSAVTVSSSVYSCSKCGHTEMVRGSPKGSKKCPKCKEQMEVLSTEDDAVENKQDE